MPEFDPLDPLPLLKEGPLSYRDEQAHATQVDAWLGLATAETEARILASRTTPAGQNLWIGLPVQTLLTPYLEIRRILAQLSPPSGSRIVDLGTGYGRMGFVVERHHPGTEFIGYEYVAERVREGARVFGRPRIFIEQADLNAPDFSPASADYYFLYDFGSREAIQKCLEDLRQIARQRIIQVVGRGRSSRDAIEREHPWLSQVITPVHGRQTSIYRSG